jgi:hypothetical protein
MRLAAVLLAATACSQHVYSPPTQAYMLGAVHALPTGGRALDLELSTHGQIFDPNFNAGQARFRTGIGDDAEVSVEGMVGGVDDHGPSTADRNLYAGRAGFRVNPSHGPFTFAVGAGGGYAPAGGSFTALDGGVQVGFDNCYLVPVASASTFVSQPLDAREIDVTDGSDHGPVYTKASRTVGGVVRGGLRLSLSPSECHAGKPSSWLTAGFDVTTLVDATDNAEMFGLGIGLELPL